MSTSEANETRPDDLAAAIQSSIEAFHDPTVGLDFDAMADYIANDIRARVFALECKAIESRQPPPHAEAQDAARADNNTLRGVIQAQADQIAVLRSDLASVTGERDGWKEQSLESTRINVGLIEGVSKLKAEIDEWEKAQRNRGTV